MPVIEYGTGKKPRRRPSWPAVFALLIPCILSLLAFLTYATYKSPPPPNSGFDALGWIFGVGALFGFLVYGTYLGAPVALVFAIISLLEIHQQPKRLAGRMPAVLAIVLSTLLLVAVTVALYRVN